MKEKLTLLIALSITFIVTFGYFLIPVVAIQSFTEQPDTVSIIVETDINTESLATPEQQEENSTSQLEEIKETETIIEKTVEIEIPEIIEEKFPTARAIWNFLRDLGYSEVVAAGIMGNFVAEVGDPSTKDINFDLDWKSNTGIELGLCQWTEGRRNDIIKIYGPNPTWEEQLQFMYNELTGTNGVRRQVSEEQYQLIINATSPEKAAYYFAIYFERCHKGSYNARQFKAVQAYEYFTQ